MNTRLAYSISEVCDLTGTKRTSIYAAIKAGILRAVKQGQRTLILDKDLRKYLNSLPTFERDANKMTKQSFDLDVEVGSIDKECLKTPYPTN